MLLFQPYYDHAVAADFPTLLDDHKQSLKLSAGYSYRFFRSRLHTLGTHYHPTLDPAVLWTPSNDTSRPIFSDSLNLTPPAHCIFGLYGAIQMLLLLLYTVNHKFYYSCM